MKNSEQLDQLLKQAFYSTVEPSEELNLKIINQLKEKRTTKPAYRKNISIALIAAAITLVMSVTSFAAWHLLNPKQVATHLEDDKLAQAFAGKDAIEINQSVVSGGYNFTLLGIVSGKGLSVFKSSIQDIYPNRTYAVVSIAMQDGSKMPNINDDEYSKNRFFISPLIKGQKPWLVNITTMNGGYSEFVIDGVMYRLIECDEVVIFADRKLYLCICSGTFYDVKAFNYDDETGEISSNAYYKGANALFNLPLDLTKANHEKAEKYLKDLLKKRTVDKTTKNDKPTYKDANIDWGKEIANGVVITESIKKVTVDKDGFAYYEYEGYREKFFVDYLFSEGEIGVYKTSGASASDGKRRAYQFSRDTDGVITGRALELK